MEADVTPTHASNSGEVDPKDTTSTPKSIIGSGGLTLPSINTKD